MDNNVLDYCSVRFPPRPNRLRPLPTALYRFASLKQAGADSRSDSQALKMSIVSVIRPITITRRVSIRCRSWSGIILCHIQWVTIGQ